MNIHNFLPSFYLLSSPNLVSVANGAKIMFQIDEILAKIKFHEAAQKTGTKLTATTISNRGEM